LTVSIHAPARGATEQSKMMDGFIAFQSTRPRGARQLAAVNAAMKDGFQSTRPRGARRRYR